MPDNFPVAIGEIFGSDGRCNYNNNQNYGHHMHLNQNNSFWMPSSDNGYNFSDNRNTTGSSQKQNQYNTIYCHKCTG